MTEYFQKSLFEVLSQDIFVQCSQVLWQNTIQNHKILVLLRVTVIESAKKMNEFFSILIFYPQQQSIVVSLKLIGNHH